MHLLLKQPSTLMLCLFGTLIVVTKGGARGRLNHAKSTTLLVSRSIRGGGEYFDSSSWRNIGVELNPNYIPPPNRGGGGGGEGQQQQPSSDTTNHHHHHDGYTLGNDDDDNDDDNVNYIQTQDLSFTPSQIPSLYMSLYMSSTPFSIMWQTFCDFHQASPSLALCMVACVVTFLTWQIPPLQPLWTRWFIASRRNVRAGRWPSLILAAISHAGLFHLIFNLAALLTFGPIVQQSLQQYGGRLSSSRSRLSAVSSSSWPMWPLLLGSALAGSITHLLMEQSGSGGGGGVGCMGLSSVALGILAVYTRLYPTITLQIKLAGIIPVGRLQAQTILRCLLAWSVLGTLRASRGKSGRTVIAHSAHLGGLLFGLAYYELWTRRFHLEQMMCHIKAQFVHSKQPKTWWSI